MKEVTSIIQVISDVGNIQLTSLVKLDKMKILKPIKSTLYLEILKDEEIVELIDNENWIEDLFISLKKSMRNHPFYDNYREQLKDDCKKHNLPFKSIRKQFRQCYKEALRLGMI